MQQDTSFWMIDFNYLWSLNRVQGRYKRGQISGLGGWGVQASCLLYYAVPGSRSFFLVFLPWALLRLRNIEHCCVISPLFLLLSIHLELPPTRSFLRRPPVALLPPILPGSQPLVLPNKYELCNLSIKYASSLNWSQGKSQFVNENNLFTDFLTFASLLLNRASRFTVVVLTFGGLTSNAVLKEEADIYLRHGLRTRLYEFLS